MDFVFPQFFLRRLVPVSAALVCASGLTLLAQTTPAKPPAAPASHHPAAAPATHPAAAQSADPVVISVATEQIRASQFKALIQAAPAENQAEMNAHKREVAEQLGQMLALVQEAQRRGLDKDAAFQAHMMLARDNALASQLVDALRAADKPTDAAVAAYYAAHADQFASFKVKHILIGDSESPGGPNPRTQAEAQAKADLIEQRLKKGEDFAAVAKAESDDPGSKDKGGELGEIQPGQTVPEFEKAAATLPLNTISDPVHSQFGYHIMVVEARTTIPLEQAKPQIIDQLSGAAIKQTVDQLTAAAKVTISDAYFGPAAPPAPPAGGGAPHP